MTDISGGHILGKDAEWAKVREMEVMRSVAGDEAGQISVGTYCFLNALCAFIPGHLCPWILSPILFFPQVPPSLDEATVITIIYAWVLFPNKTVNYFRSRMVSLIIYNPPTIPRRILCISTLTIWSRIKLWPTAWFTTYRCQVPVLRPGTHRPDNNALSSKAIIPFTPLHGTMWGSIKTNSAGLLRTCLLNMYTVGYKRGKLILIIKRVQLSFSYTFVWEP